MFWGLSFHLLSEEVIVEDSTQKKQSGLKPMYSVFLTNKRVIFRFDGLGSSLTQSFSYEEIEEVRPCRRLFVSYLDVRTTRKNFLLNTGDTDHWAKRILEMKSSLSKAAEPHTQAAPVSSGRIKGELTEMLATLRRYALLSEKELEDKLRLLESMKF